MPKVRTFSSFETGLHTDLQQDEPVNWGIEGRGGLTSWKTLGYIPTDDFDPNGKLFLNDIGHCSIRHSLVNRSWYLFKIHLENRRICLQRLLHCRNGPVPSQDS